jgi:hypothetical protein
MAGLFILIDACAFAPAARRMDSAADKDYQWGADGGAGEGIAVLNSRILQIPILRPYARAYEIVSNPANFPQWSPILEGRFEARGNNGLDWLVDLPSGTAVLRFTPPNPYGVLDYTIIPEDGGRVRNTPLRLLHNEDACELVAQYFQWPEQDDEAFASYVEWARTDLMVLKSVVEAS